MCYILALSRTIMMKALGKKWILWCLNTCKDQSHDSPGISYGSESRVLKKQGRMSIDVLNFGVGKKIYPENTMDSQKHLVKTHDQTQIILFGHIMQWFSI